MVAAAPRVSDEVRQGGVGNVQGAVGVDGEHVAPIPLLAPEVVSVHRRQALWQDEVFGPVVAVCTADGFEEAV
ncbi:MAG: aldehyde dehydrogenase family protein [Streptosporangiaceae bacterium]|nr:aldehyde dehydrogenase family protein [Streptosporangiaceae bacterium]MBV9856984.1 aldehyde dehydrogenase family protein [Streptosporangiaceae bacterium]